jgi:hypothetical protein
LYFSSTKLNTSNYKTLFHKIFSLRHPGLLISPEYIPLSVRFKSNINSKKHTNKTLQKVEDKEDSDEEGDHNERSEQEEELEDDPSVPKDYKDLDKVVQSFRYDVVLKTGLDIGRNKIEDAFYKGELRLNGEKLWKKSRTVRLHLPRLPDNFVCCSASTQCCPRFSLGLLTHGEQWLLTFSKVLCGPGQSCGNHQQASVTQATFSFAALMTL